MTLDDWIRLSVEERHKLLSEWGDDSDKWWPIAHEAAERLQRDLADRLEVLYVHEAHTMSGNGEPQIYIYVATRLPHGHNLPDVPSEYQSFPVNQEGLAEDIAAFQSTWAAILKRIFDWNQVDIQHFIDKQEWVYHSGFFLHDSPLATMPRSMLCDALVGKRELSEAHRIGEEINRAIDADGRHVDHFYLADDPEFDWAAAKKRVEAVVAKYR